jgi:hypothetical protein
MSSFNPGQRVRYSEEFLAAQSNTGLRESLAALEGTVVDIMKSGELAQIDFGCRFRATSVVKVQILEQVQ